jgi:two-component system, sensor histidine kinase ChiS
MLFYGVPLNPIIFIIIMLELVVLWNETLAWLARPNEKDRLWHLLLIALLVMYNMTENLVVMPDKHIPLPDTLQVILNYSFGYCVTAYMPFYGYKTMHLPKLKFHAHYGHYFIMFPVAFFFYIYYPIHHDLETTLQYAYILPAIYAAFALTAVGRAIYSKWKEDGNREALKQRLWIYIALLFWCISPVVGLVLGQPNWVLGVFNNVVFLAMNILLVRETVKQSRAEYLQLQQSNITLAEKVRERTIQLEKSIEQRTNAFVNLVHETKTPITLMNNYLEEYMQKLSKDDEDLNIVKLNLDKLNNDISNMFDLERYARGTAIYNYGQLVDVSQLVKDNLLLFKGYCERKGVSLSQSVLKDIFLNIDPEAINRIINNLVGNAIKYTSDGGHIHVKLERSAGEILLAVEDNGIGIPPELHDKIFEPYYQINTQKKSAQGMGLGLPIVKRIVDSLQGKITVDSAPGQRQGTRIAIRVKDPELKPQETPSYKVSNNMGLEINNFHFPDSTYDKRKQTILLVEDNNAMVNYLFKKLKEKYNVFIAFNGNEALKKLKQYPVLPDLIISDVMMDKVDGFKFAQIMSEIPDLNHIPFIFLSAKFTTKDKALGLKLGALDYLPKPFRTEELLQKVDAVLKNVLKQKTALLQSTIKALKMLEQADTDTREDADSGFEYNCTLYGLTSREVDIARQICEGHSYKVIGDTLFIAERTVKKHVQNIFEKVGTSNKVQLINKLQA